MDESQGLDTGDDQTRTLEAEMRSSFIDYSMSVIVQRALPDVRDGLKPVHRRILYAMLEAGLSSNRPYKKCATVVGDVLGKYHPHGDGAVYNSLVRMAQDFSLRYPLVDGQGNFGSVDGDSAAAYRYTEARLASVSGDMLADIDKETVDFQPNFDGRLEEPVVLPAAIPNLLVNGSSGIAVGMATNIPPHNLGEAVEACCKLIDDPTATVDDLMESMPGPDFPTGGFLLGTEGIADTYREGRGKLIVRGRTEIEERRDNRTRIIITEIPFMVNKARLVRQIAQLVRDRRITDISDLRDESGRDGIRVVVDLKRGAMEQVVLNQLYKHTQLQNHFGAILLALDRGRPKVLGLKALLERFVAHRHEVVVRRTEFELAAARDREHVLEGLVIAVGAIDRVIKIIRGSRDAKKASRALREEFDLTERQAGAVLDMRLSRLTSLETEKLEEELRTVRALREDLESILGSRTQRMSIVKNELRQSANKHGDKRRTEILGHYAHLSTVDLIADEPTVVTFSRGGYVKRTEPGVYRAQRRGGRGIQGMGTREDDGVDRLLLTSTHDTLLVFTGGGRVYRLRAWEVPETRRAAQGRHVANLLKMEKGEKIAAVINVRGLGGGQTLMFATRRGVVKRVRLDLFSNVRANGIWACQLADGDELIDVQVTDGDNDVMLATRKGRVIRFHETDVRQMGRMARGVRGVTLRGDDIVVGLVVARRDATLLTATVGGIGKRTQLAEYPLRRRGGLGVINVHPKAGLGHVVAVREVEDGDELMLVTQHGVINRQPVSEIRVIGRYTRGVRLIALDKSDTLVDAALVPPDPMDGNGTPPEGDEPPADGGEVAPAVAEESAVAAGEGVAPPSGGSG